MRKRKAKAKFCIVGSSIFENICFQENTDEKEYTDDSKLLSGAIKKIEQTQEKYTIIF